MGRLKARANLNGGELDCEHTSQRDKRRATLKGRNLKRRGSEPGQPQWWRAGLGAIHPNKEKTQGQPIGVSWGGKSITEDNKM